MIALRFTLAALVVFGVASVLALESASPFATRPLLVVHLVSSAAAGYLAASRIRAPFLYLAAGLATILAPAIADAIGDASLGVAGGHAARCLVMLCWQAAAFALLARFDSSPNSVSPANALGFVVAIVVAVAVPAQFLDATLDRLRLESVDALQAGKLARAEERATTIQALGSRELPFDRKKLKEQLTLLAKRVESRLPRLEQATALAQLGRHEEALVLLDDGIESRLLRASILQDQGRYAEADEHYRAVFERFRSEVDPRSPIAPAARLAERALTGLVFDARMSADGPAAVSLAASGLALFPHRAGFWSLQLALAQDLADDPRSARASFEEAVRLDPSLAPIVEPQLQRLRRGYGCIPR